MKWKERGMVSMINKDYFKYLIKQNKKYLILIYVIGIIIPFWIFNEFTPSFNTSGLLSLCYGLILSCIVPIYLFSFLQKKKSNLLYFSLPVKKESLYLTTSIFSYFATIIPVVIYQLIAQCIVAYKGDLSFNRFILAIIITIVHMFVMNTLITTITLLTQNIVDSLICSGAAIFLPFLIFIALNNCATTNVYTMMLGTGNYTQGLTSILYYLSIPYSGLGIMNHIEIYYLSYVSAIYWFSIGLILCIINYRLFLKRTIEQSESHTKSFFMYPLIITLGTFSMLLIMYSLDLKSNIVPFTIIFVLYLIMLYFSKRKVYFNLKIPVIFMILIAGCIGFSNIYAQTNGFNTLYEVPVSSTIESTSLDFSFETNSETKKALTYKETNVTEIHFYSSTNKNNTKCVDFINEIFSQNLITGYDDFYKDTNNNDFYIMHIDYTIKPNNNGGTYIERDYIIEEKNMKKVLELINKYSFDKNIEL